MRASPQLDRFVRAVHRRHVALRIVESAGIGIAAGCAIGAMLVAALLWRGEDAWTIAAIAMTAGALCGAIWGAKRRPNALAAAVEADRQLNTADLLATAWTLRGFVPQENDDTFRESVLALAADRCTRIHPSAVLLRRLGARAWGGIALAVAFIVTMATMSPSPLEARDGGRDGSSRGQTSVNPTPREIGEVAVKNDRPQHRIERTPGDESQPGEKTDGSRAAANDNPADPSTHSGDARSKSSDNSDSTGNAEGTTRTPGSLDPSRPSAFANSSTEKTGPRSSNNVAGGTGRAASAPSKSNVSTGGTVSSDNVLQASPPPWRSTAWPQSVESARRDVASGRIPDDSRDLVHGYFDPHP